MGSTLKFGLFVPQGWKLDLTEIADPVAQFEAMTAVAQAADQDGWDSIWVYDHFHTVPTPEREATFECWTSSATLARDTSRVKIGQMVGCNGYRNPALYAKIASTVDVASHGRLVAGIGAGWYEHEWRAYGFPWWETKERMRHVQEAVEINHRMWTEATPVFHGVHYAVDGAINEPRGAGHKHQPLWIGGEGEQVTLKLVAEWGDGCDVGGGDPEVCRHKLAVLTRHCDRLGRNAAEITKSTSIEPLVLLERETEAERGTAPRRGDPSLAEYCTQAWVGTSAQISERLQDLVDVGINYVIVTLPRVASEPEPRHHFAHEVIPKFA
jgi:F420-dependent oxidoreductase-like protein